MKKSDNNYLSFKGKETKMMAKVTARFREHAQMMGLIQKGKVTPKG